MLFLIFLAAVAAPLESPEPPPCEKWSESDWDWCDSRCAELKADETVCLDGYCFCCTAGTCYPEPDDPGC